MVRLTKEEIQFYQDNGFIKLAGVLSDQEMDTISKEFNRILNLQNNPGIDTAREGKGMKQTSKTNDVQSACNLQFNSSIFSNLLHNNTLLEALEDIMGTPNILLHHTKAHRESPGKSSPFLIHQDYNYFPFKKHSMVVVFLYIDDSSPENGGLCVYPGSHKPGPLQHEESLGNAGVHYYMDPSKYPIDKATPICTKRGEFVIFSYLLLHGSYRNLRDRSRCVYLVRVMSADDEPMEDVPDIPGRGWVLRGSNDKRQALLSERFLH